jgi:hypothetical protein
VGFLTRRYERRVPKRLRDLGESYGAPRPNRYLPSAEGGAVPDEQSAEAERDFAAEDEADREATAEPVHAA